MTHKTYNTKETTKIKNYLEKAGIEIKDLYGHPLKHSFNSFNISEISNYNLVLMEMKRNSQLISSKLIGDPDKINELEKIAGFKTEIKK